VWVRDGGGVFNAAWVLVGTGPGVLNKFSRWTVRVDRLREYLVGSDTSKLRPRGTGYTGALIRVRGAGKMLLLAAEWKSALRR